MFDLLEKTGEPLTNWLSTRLRRKGPMALDQLVGFHAKKIELETEMLKIWKEPKTGRVIDAFICPVAPHPVPPIDRWNGVSYTSTFVLLDYPAGTLPVRDFVESDLRGELADTKPLGSWDKANRELCKSHFATSNSKPHGADDNQGIRKRLIGRYISTQSCLCKLLHLSYKKGGSFKRCGAYR